MKTQSAQTSPKLKFRYEIMPLSIQYLHLKSPLLVKNMTLLSKHLALMKCQKSLWCINKKSQVFSLIKVTSNEDFV